MLKKTITFEDLDGNKITEEFHFHLTKADIAALELSQKGGLSEYITKITNEEDGAKLVELFKDLLIRSVGKRSADGRRFDRSKEIVDDFAQSDAYSEMFVELASNSELAAAFVNGVIPASMQAEAAKNENTTTVELPSAAIDSTEPAWISEGRTPTPEEVKNATPEQLQIAFQRKQATPEITPPLA